VGLELGGWTLDDVQVTTLDPIPTDCAPSAYGSAVPGAAGIPALDTAGQAPRVGNGDFGVKLKNARPSASAFLALGLAPTSVPFAGGEVLLVPAFVVQRATDEFGQASVAFPLSGNPANAGISLYFQAFVLDPGAPEGIAITSGLEAKICP
jgi:hypothetical protein